MARIDLLARPDHAAYLYAGLKDRLDLHLHVFNALAAGSLPARWFPNRKQVAAGADVLWGMTLGKLALNAARKLIAFNGRAAEQRLAEFVYGRIDLSRTQLVHYWPMYCEKTVRTARERYGLKTLADVYEANPVFVNALVAEEYRRFGIPFSPINTQVEQNAFFAHERQVVTPSAYIEQSYAAEFPNVSWHRAPYGFFGQRAQAELLKLRAPGRLRAVYVGRVCLEKGVQYLCEALRGLEREVELDIIGPVQGDHAPAFEAYKTLPGLRFLGGMSHREVLTRLPGYDVFVMPSLSDAYSLAVMEGLMHGLPAIVTENTGCYGEIRAHGCGAVVPIRDSEALRQALLDFVSRERRQEAIDGIARFDAAEAEHGFLGTMSAIYQQILNGTAV